MISEKTRNKNPHYCFSSPLLAVWNLPLPRFEPKLALEWHLEYTKTWLVRSKHSYGLSSIRKVIFPTHTASSIWHLNHRKFCRNYLSCIKSSLQKFPSFSISYFFKSSANPACKILRRVQPLSSMHGWWHLYRKGSQNNMLMKQASKSLTCTSPFAAMLLGMMERLPYGLIAKLKALRSQELSIVLWLYHAHLIYESCFNVM